MNPLVKHAKNFSCIQQLEHVSQNNPFLVEALLDAFMQWWCHSRIKNHCCQMLCLRAVALIYIF